MQTYQHSFFGTMEHHCATSCGPGYCDLSLGQCVCPPGWRGRACDDAYLGACRTSLSSPVMACEGFAGVMSCACKRACWERLGLNGVKAKPCFELASGLEPPISDFPGNTSAVRVRIKLRGPSIPVEQADRLMSRHSSELSGLMPQPNARCPRECSHSGTCFRDGRGVLRCMCHAGFVGVACERLNPRECINGCSGRGACLARFCRCLPGWFGADCSLSLSSGGAATAASAVAASGVASAYSTPSAAHGSAAVAWNAAALPRRTPTLPLPPPPPPSSSSSSSSSHPPSSQPTPPTAQHRGARRRYVPIYAYSLPDELSTMHHLYQNDPTTRGVFYANRVLLQQLLARQDAVVAAPEHAALFLVPVMLVQLHGQSGRLGEAMAAHHGLLSLHLKAWGCPPHS